MQDGHVSKHKIVRRLLHWSCVRRVMGSLDEGKHVGKVGTWPNKKQNAIRDDGESRLGMTANRTNRAKY